MTPALQTPAFQCPLGFFDPQPSLLPRAVGRMETCKQCGEYNGNICEA